MRRALLVVMLLAGAAPAAAQQRPPTAADTLTAEQRALERLRALRRVAQPDTVTEPADSIEAQTVAVTPGAAPRTAVPPSQIARDSIMTLLLGVGGYIGTEYSADSARYFAERSRLELRGSPKVAREGNQLVADSSIIYNQALSLACGYGSPVLHAADQSEPLASDTVCFDVERQVGRAPGASTRVQEGATWNVHCDAYFVADQLYCHDAIFTDCDEPYPHYHYAFGAGELKAIRGNVIVARNVTMRFADVPVFWLPFMVQSLSRGRRSGILMPRFGINDIARNSTRYNRRIEDVGFYWAINDYMGTELAMDWHANNWTSLRGSFDYRWLRRFLRGGLTYRQFWRNEGGREFTLSSNNSWDLDERTSIGLNANYLTSTQFVKQRTFDPRELNRTIDSQGSIRRRFDWGSASLGVSRRQQLSNNTVDLELPNFRLSVSPLTLFEALPGEERWYSNTTWSGSGDVKIDRRDIDATNPSLQSQSSRNLTSNLRSNLNIGRLSWGQSFSLTDETREARTVPGDSAVEIAGLAQQRGRWNTSVSFEQRLIATSTITPSISFNGEYLRNDSTGQAIVTSPTRVNFNSSLRLEMYGFWPGFGPFERLRHRVTPTFSYGYSPAARADSLQRAIFGEGIVEQNRITIGLSQTFEAKYRSRPGDGDAAGRARTPAARDTAVLPGDTAGVQQDTARALRRSPGAGDTLGGVMLRRREQVATVSLLEVSTEALVYDFVRARDDYGLVNTQIRNSLRSDLLRGLQMSVTHDLFSTSTDSLGEVSRSFAPHMREVNASFSVNANSWLFRILRLGSADTVDTRTDGAPLEQGDPNAAGPAVDRTETEYGMIGTGRRTAEGTPRGTVGSWNASINYSLFRPRSGTSSASENQMVRGNVTFQPTENWTLRWTTGYSITTTQFSDHVLTLTRTLHDWDANFDFVKAQNGNFSFQFRVHLRANPDVKLDYQQQESPALQTVR